MQFKFSDPETWKPLDFSKDEWGSINYFLGPNGTRKTRCLRWLKTVLNRDDKELKSRYVGCDRLGSISRLMAQGEGVTYASDRFNPTLAPHKSSDAQTHGLIDNCFHILMTRYDLRVRIQSTLSQLFNREFKFEEAGGFARPKVDQDGLNYNAITDECNGIKQLIGLLTVIYDNTYDYILIDEPEANLHPQMQSLLMREIRNQAGAPSLGKKIFFIATHSPFMLDVRNAGDLEHCLFFREGGVPTVPLISDLADRNQMTSLLARMNAHHKQFFFATAPVIVEGQKDEELFLLIQEKRGLVFNTSDCLIGAGGSEQVEDYFKLAKYTNKRAKFIVDLDVLETGALRKTVGLDQNCIEALRLAGVSSSHDQFLDALWSKIDGCIAAFPQQGLGGSLAAFDNAIAGAAPDKKRRYFLMTLLRNRAEFDRALPQLISELSSIEGDFRKIQIAWLASKVNLLDRGAIEHYVPYLPTLYCTKNEKKSALLQARNDLAMNTHTEAQLRASYSELLDVLDWAFPADKIVFEDTLNEIVRDWIFKLHKAVKNKAVKNWEELRTDTNLDCRLHGTLFGVTKFELAKSGYEARIKFAKSVDHLEREFEFDMDFNPIKFDIKTLTQSQT